MNREELKKEAQEQVNYCTPLYPESFIQGYLAGAEPRENKIAVDTALFMAAYKKKKKSLDTITELPTLKPNATAKNIIVMG